MTAAGVMVFGWKTYPSRVTGTTARMASQRVSRQLAPPSNANPVTEVAIS